MLIATAGHVDHGKTVLVHALTGVDTDRLPEEKARGLTIDLGFAYRALDSGDTLGFVDVPGHEKFIRNMLAGVSAIDFALLVVAADDGVMPQTEEHLAILDLIGIERGAVALSKIDRVDPTQVAAVADEIEALLAPTRLAGAPIFPVCAQAGDGVPELQAHLESSAERLDARSQQGHFRLAIDRSFSVTGAGVVVTGAAFSGAVRAGDRLRLQPQGIEVRVRGIHAGHEKASEGGAGQRLALNITGADLELGDLHRGDWLVSEALDFSTRRIDVQLRVLPSESKPLAHWTPVHVHIGSGFLTGRVAVLQGRNIPPEQEGLVQLYLDRATQAVAGDRFIVRDQSGRRTVGGGEVIDPLPPARGRSKPERIAMLEALREPNDDLALAACLAQAANGIDLDEFAFARNISADQAAKMYEHGGVVEIPIRRRRAGLAAARWKQIRVALVDALGEWHREHADRVGPDEGTVCRAIGALAQRTIALAALRALTREGAIVRDGQSVRLPEHVPKLSGADAELWQSIAAELTPQATKPPVVSELASRLRVQKPALVAFLNRSVGRRQLIRVADNRYFHPRAVAKLAEVAERLAAGNAKGAFDAKAYRDKSGIGRNLTIQVLEYFDAVGLTRRLGDERIVVGTPAEIFGDSSR